MNGHGVLTTFEDNYLHDLAQGVADSAGFYAGRTWCDRGNIVRRNRFSRFLATEKLAQSTSVNGIYLDDMESGWVVEDNHFETIHMVSLPPASPSPARAASPLPHWRRRRCSTSACSSAEGGRTQSCGTPSSTALYLYTSTTEG